jgi:hypothetical protein
MIVIRDQDVSLLVIPYLDVSTAAAIGNALVNAYGSLYLCHVFFDFTDACVWCLEGREASYRVSYIAYEGYSVCNGITTINVYGYIHLIAIDAPPQTVPASMLPAKDDNGQVIPDTYSRKYPQTSRYIMRVGGDHSDYVQLAGIDVIQYQLAEIMDLRSSDGNLVYFLQGKNPYHYVQEGARLGLAVYHDDMVDTLAHTLLHHVGYATNGATETISGPEGWSLVMEGSWTDEPYRIYVPPYIVKPRGLVGIIPGILLTGALLLINDWLVSGRRRGNR